VASGNNQPILVNADRQLWVDGCPWWQAEIGMSGQAQ